MELQHQRHGLIAVRPQIFGVDTRTCHAGKPQVQKVAAVPAGHLFGLGDGIVQRHRVCLGHARLPKRLKVRGLRRGPIVAAQRLDFTCSHLCTFFFYFIKVNSIRFGAKMQVIIQARFTSTPLFLIAAIAVRPAARSFPLPRLLQQIQNKYKNTKAPAWIPGAFARIQVAASSASTASISFIIISLPCTR